MIASQPEMSGFFASENSRASTHSGIGREALREKPMTRWPRALASSTTREPMKRVAPVMPMFMRKVACVAGLLRAGTPLNVQQQAHRVFDAFLHAHQKRDGFFSIHDAVIVAEREIHHRADDDLAVDCHRALLGFVHSQNAALRRI